MLSFTHVARPLLRREKTGSASPSLRAVLRLLRACAASETERGPQRDDPFSSDVTLRQG